MEIEKMVVDVDINFPDGNRSIQMLLKEKGDIEECEIGKICALNLRNGELHTGVFKGMEGDEDIMLGSLSGKYTLGYKIWWLSDYFEQV